MATEYTYVMASTEIKVRVKIGKSKSPTKRLASLQTGSGEKLFVVGVSDKYREDALHYKYNRYHNNGEWFDLPLDDLLELVRDISHPLAFAKKQEGVDSSFHSINDELTPTAPTMATKEPSNVTPAEPSKLLYPSLFDLKHFDGDLYIVTGSNALENFLIQLDRSGRPFCDSYFCHRDGEVKPLLAKYKAIAKQHGLWLGGDDINVKVFDNCNDLVAKFKAIMAPVVIKVPAKPFTPKPFTPVRSHSGDSDDSDKSSESDQSENSGGSRKNYFTSKTIDLTRPLCKGVFATGDRSGEKCPYYAKIRGYCKMHLSQEPSSVETKLSNLTITAPKPTKKICYEVAKICGLLPERLIDLRSSFIDHYFSAKVIGEICDMSLGRDKSATVKRAMENYYDCNALLKLSPALIEKLTKSHPERKVLKKHPDLLVSASKFRQAIVDYFQPQWAKLDLTRPGNLDLDLAATIAEQFVKSFRPLSLVENLNITVNCDHKHKDLFDDNKLCLFSRLVRNQYGRQVIVKELTVVLSSFFGLTPKTLTDLTKVNDPVKAVDKLVFYHGRALLDMSANSLIDSYYYDTETGFIEV